MQASVGNHIPFSTSSLWPDYYHSIDKLNPRLIWIAPLYNLLFIHCFSLPYILLNLIIFSFCTAAATNCEHLSDSMLPSACFLMKRKSEVKIFHTVINSIVFILNPMLQSFSIILIGSDQNPGNSFALEALACWPGQGLWLWNTYSDQILHPGIDCMKFFYHINSINNDIILSGESIEKLPTDEITRPECHFFDPENWIPEIKALNHSKAKITQRSNIVIKQSYSLIHLPKISFRLSSTN